MFDQTYPRLRIAGPNCKLVRTNELFEGTWFLDYPNGDFENIVGNVRVTIEGVRMKAQDWIVSPPVVSIDKNSPCYKAIQLRSGKDDEKCLWGPEYSLKINNRVPALLYLGNKSSRGLMSTIRVNGDYVLLPQKRTYDKFVWYVPNAIAAKTFDEAAGD